LGEVPLQNMDAHQGLSCSTRRFIQLGGLTEFDVPLFSYCVVFPPMQPQFFLLLYNHYSPLFTYFVHDQHGLLRENMDREPPHTKSLKPR